MRSVFRNVCWSPHLPDTHVDILGEPTSEQYTPFMKDTTPARGVAAMKYPANQLSHIGVGPLSEVCTPASNRCGTPTGVHNEGWEGILTRCATSYEKTISRGCRGTEGVPSVLQ